MFDPHFQFKTWILTIAQNTIIDFWRKKSKENQDPTENLDEVKNSMPNLLKNYDFRRRTKENH
jgi:DNA-directed RNA polymerase specialized sigma24 family protein